IEPLKLVGLPPLQPFADAVSIDLIDVSDLPNRVAPIAEQNGMGTHPPALRGLRFHDFFELGALLLSQRLHKLCRAFHSANILPQNFWFCRKVSKPYYRLKRRYMKNTICCR